MRKTGFIFHFKGLLGSLTFILLLSHSATAQTSHDTKRINWNEEIIYHVMPRSFYDSNGDLHGDLQGFRQKLDYLKDLGVTTILFTPLYESDFYHNYFPTDYKKIDPEFGTMEDYINFVKAVHAKGLKFLMDMETQYAQNGHPWFDDSYKNPDSKYSDHILYSDSLNRYPYQIFIKEGEELYQFKAWPEQDLNIVYLNLNNPEVKQYMANFYSFWADPNSDGNLEDGVDGYRIDHIMDDLDNRGVITDMYKEFWNPVFKAARKVNPDLFIVGEQSDWSSYGEEMIEKSGADASFAFHIRYAVAGTAASYMGTEDVSTGEELTAEKIIKAVNTTLESLPEGSYFVNFLENHDMERWASAVNGDKRKLRTGAVLNLTLPGIPSIYYGQELGLPGKVGDWGYDVSHLPVREAFPWTPDANNPGTAVFYKNTGAWWDNSFFNMGLSEELALSTQRPDENSLWNHYRKLIEIRKGSKALTLGKFEDIQVKNKQLLAFKRIHPEEEVLVLINLSETEKTDLEEEDLDLTVYEILYSGKRETENNFHALDPFEFMILKKR